MELAGVSFCSWASDTLGSSFCLLPAKPLCTAGGRRDHRADPSAAPHSQSSPDTPHTLSTAACHTATLTNRSADDWRYLLVVCQLMVSLRSHDNSRGMMHSDSCCQCWGPCCTQRVCCCPDWMMIACGFCCYVEVCWDSQGGHHSAPCSLCLSVNYLFLPAPHRTPPLCADQQL